MFSSNIFLILTILKYARCGEIIPSKSQRLTSIPWKPCRIPQSNDHYYTTLDSNKIYTKGDLIDGSGQNTVVVVCLDRWQLSRASDAVVCFDGEWYPSDHTCVYRTCDPLSDTHTTIHSCITQNDTEVSCHLPAAPGTKVNIQCINRRYSLDGKYKSDLPHQIKRNCSKGGVWEDYQRCKADCGTVYNTTSNRTSQNTAILEILLESPWHAVIYRLKDQKWHPFCSGTIISDFMILTADLCVSENEQTIPSSELKVAVGKYFADFSQTESSSHKYDVSRSYWSSAYTFAVIAVSENIKYSDTVGPACIYGRSEDGSEGHIAAWNKDVTGSISRVGKTLEYVSCGGFLGEIKRKPSDFHFCTSSTDGSRFSAEDIGGAFVFRQSDGHYFVQGVLGTLLEDGNVAIFVVVHTQKFYKFMDDIFYDSRYHSTLTNKI